ncbi:unnamed protein product, partial [Ectocarpus sp. 8 AP-2014]
MVGDFVATLLVSRPRCYAQKLLDFSSCVSFAPEKPSTTSVLCPSIPVATPGRPIRRHPFPLCNHETHIYLSSVFVNLPVDIALPRGFLRDKNVRVQTESLVFSARPPHVRGESACSTSHLFIPSSLRTVSLIPHAFLQADGQATTTLNTTRTCS